MRRVAYTALVAVGCGLLGCATVSGGTQGTDSCSLDQLALKRLEPSPPQQTQATGLAVYNTGAPCRLVLPVSLTLTHANGRALRVAGGTSRLTLIAARLGTGASASATWTYTNYCGADSKDSGPKAMQIFRAGWIELRRYGGGAPCYAPQREVELRLFSACPAAKGPAVDALNKRPRSWPMCRR
jgi:hypothetical protein